MFGEEHRETATSKNELGLLLWEQGDLDGAEKMFRESVATHTRLLGADHANAAVGKANLAVVVNEQGHPAAAEALLRESLASQRKTLGVRHPSYANTLNKLSVVVMDQGRLDEANALIEEALRTAGMVFADDHPRMVLYRVNQARIQIARREPDKAEPVLRQVLDAAAAFLSGRGLAHRPGAEPAGRLARRAGARRGSGAAAARGGKSAEADSRTAGAGGRRQPRAPGLARATG